MREIKFRAWDKEKNGFSYVQIQANYISMPIDIESNHVESNGSYPQIEAVRFDFVIAWQQYTGLKDKNGKEIYEGDIVNNEYGTQSKIGFKEGYFSMTDTKSGYNNVGIWNVHKQIEVIANIHENPELKKEEK